MGRGFAGILAISLIVVLPYALFVSSRPARPRSGRSGASTSGGRTRPNTLGCSPRRGLSVARRGLARRSRSAPGSRVEVGRFLADPWSSRRAHAPKRGGRSLASSLPIAHNPPSSRSPSRGIRVGVDQRLPVIATVALCVGHLRPFSVDRRFSSPSFAGLVLARRARLPRGGDEAARPARRARSRSVSARRSSRGTRSQRSSSRGAYDDAPSIARPACGSARIRCVAAMRHPRERDPIVMCEALVAYYRGGTHADFRREAWPTCSSACATAEGRAGRRRSMGRAAAPRANAPLLDSDRGAAALAPLHSEDRPRPLRMYSRAAPARGRWVSRAGARIRG